MKLSDTIYQEKLDHVEQFAFNKDVASVFNDMITRSVPGYHLTLKLLSSLCTEYSQSNSNYYDLGCSTGGSTLIFNHSISGENNHIFALKID